MLYECGGEARRGGGESVKKEDAQPLNRCVDLRSGVIELAKCILGMHLLLDACILRTHKSSGMHYVCIHNIFM